MFSFVCLLMRRGGNTAPSSSVADTSTAPLEFKTFPQMLEPRFDAKGGLRLVLKGNWLVQTLWRWELFCVRGDCFHFSGWLEEAGKGETTHAHSQHAHLNHIKNKPFFRLVPCSIFPPYVIFDSISST